MTRRMAVLVGSDRRRFDRLVGYVERWAAGFGDWEVQVQHGVSRPPSTGDGVAFCDPDRVTELLQEADLVVCDGAPNTITAARRLGHRPIVVPRDPSLGEHADARQQRFARRLGRAGAIDLAESEDAFLAAAVSSAFLPRMRTVADEIRSTRVPPGVHRVAAIAEELAGLRAGDRPSDR